MQLGFPNSDGQEPVSTMFSHVSLAEDTAPSFERPVDLVHLARQTLGDRALEREVLGLFLVQARALYAQLESVSEETLRHDLAHTLKGSARAGRGLEGRGGRRNLRAGARRDRRAVE